MRISYAALGLLAVLALPSAASAQTVADTVKSVAAPDPALMAPAIIEQGRKIFHGQGNCYACHGDKLEGGPIAPPLRGPTWRHIDGTHAAIVHRVDEGQPGTAMVAHPGGITEAQVILVATYVYAVSHGAAKP